MAYAENTANPNEAGRDRGHDVPPSLDPAELKQIRERIRMLTHIMDEVFVVPGTNLRFGIDPLLGLVPGAGDLISMLPSLYILWEAKRIGISRKVRMRMLVNVMLDTMIGSVPILGQAVDFAWKANVQNAKMMGIDLSDEDVSSER